ncbi:UbiA family prenyltransferase [Demequina aurantiaca]|uniref:UbiA family prenyltransferase n=1 Tax=Demequina aurantiaca TaxID=676200 RepID=UPI003D32751C
MPMVKQARALALASHPIPTVAVTALGAGLAALAGLSLGRGALVTLAIFTGQLSIGWSNDYLDAERDRSVNRTDKPLAIGAMGTRVVGIAAVVALVLTIAFSAALGWRGGTAALVIVVCGWAYNLGLKGTWLSWAPYAIAFGMLPAVATLSAIPPRWPQPWALAAGALLGVAAHLANVLPDLKDDVATGIRALPHRIGARATALSAAVILLAASTVMVFGPEGDPNAWHWAAFGAAAIVATAAVRLAIRDGSSKLIFLAMLVVAVIDLVTFALAGDRL